MREKGIPWYPLFLLMMKKTLICIVVLLLFGIAQASEKRVDVPIGDSPSLGPDDAPITIIEFIDFQ